ncbi:ABC transporter permease [Cobetia marina]|uniref:ABC transporter permease n=1 Tax=Cobetia marina TaxID=28258 RepID=UPI0026E1A8D7|nr:ABC transporter permease [Cobetia marina]MDO6788350.1 ABC transporter permease [Cobetia marina]
MNFPSRLLQLLMVVLMVGGASYLMMQSLPGDAAWRIAAGRYGYDALDAAAAASVRAELGLEAQGGLHFLYWLGDILRLELGTSLISGESVWVEIRHQLGNSLSLAGAALGISLLIGPPLGLLAGLRAGGWLDRSLLAVCSLLRATPQFLLALVLILLISVEMGLLPAAGHGEPQHFILPAMTLALGLAAVSARLARDAMAAVTQTAFHDFARWKGLSNAQTFWRHGLRHVALPLVTYLGLQFVTLVEGVVVIESIFGWPGIGHALVHAIFSRDVPMVQGTALVLGVGFVVINLLVDLLGRQLDPRGVK